MYIYILDPIKMKFYFTAILLVSLSSYGQNITFREIKLTPHSRYYKTKEKTIIYPIVVTNNKKFDSLINSQIKNEMFSPDDEKQSINKTLDENTFHCHRRKRNAQLSIGITQQSIPGYRKR